MTRGGAVIVQHPGGQLLIAHPLAVVGDGNDYISVLQAGAEDKGASADLFHQAVPDGILDNRLYNQRRQCEFGDLNIVLNTQAFAEPGLLQRQISFSQLQLLLEGNGCFLVTEIKASPQKMTEIVEQMPGLLVIPCAHPDDCVDRVVKEMGLDLRTKHSDFRAEPLRH
ncbi:hypothetical protein D3C80_1527210 [compost metagenome]